jgi:hypothetical protein
MSNTLRAALRTAPPARLPAIATLLAQHLHADPRFGPIPDRENTLSGYAQHVLRCAYQAGSVDVVLSGDTDGRLGPNTLVGVAVAMPYPGDPAHRLLPTSEQDRLPGLHALPGLDDLTRNLTELGRREQLRRPRCEPYQVLEFLAVHPSAPYEQAGAKLLRILRKRLDATGSSCYTDARGAHTQELLRHHGFIVLDRPAPGADQTTSQRMWRMWRDPVVSKRRVYPAEMFRLVAELYRQQGLPIGDIAAKAGCTESTVYYMLKTLGLAADNRTALPDTAVQRYQNGETTPENIAADLGIPTHRVLKLLTEAGADVPADYEERVRADIVHRYTTRRETVDTIRLAVGRSKPYVRNTLTEAGVPLRPRGRPAR